MNSLWMAISMIAVVVIILGIFFAVETDSLRKENIDLTKSIGELENEVRALIERTTYYQTYEDVKSNSGMRIVHDEYFEVNKVLEALMKDLGKEAKIERTRESVKIGKCGE